MPRVSEEHLTARREQILAAARACFQRKGLHNTSMQDLIQEAGLSVGAVYRYFKSKTEIINAIAETVAGGLTAQLYEIADRDLPLVEAMAQTLDALEDQLGAHGNFALALQIWAEATIDPAIGAIARERFLGIRAAFARYAENAVRRGELPAGTDVAGVSSALSGMLPGYGLQRLLIGDPDRQTYLAGVRALIG